jgi:hypothetical protein
MHCVGGHLGVVLVVLELCLLEPLEDVARADYLCLVHAWGSWKCGHIGLLDHIEPVRLAGHG